MGVSRLDFNDWREGSRSFAGLTVMQGAPMNVSDEGRAPEQFQGTYGSANLFQLIGQRPRIGRNFRPGDEAPGAEAAVIIGGWRLEDQIRE